MINFRRLCCWLSVLLVLATGCNEQTALPTAVAGGAPTNTSEVSGAPDKFTIGIVVYLSGGAAEPFGIPAKHGAEVILAALNRGAAPAPYDKPGIAGVPITAIYVDEEGTVENQVAEARRLFLEEDVDLLIGYISSRDCLAVAPLADELKELVVAFDCGTSRLFEERDYQYVFRTNAHQAIDSLAGARYLLRVKPDLETVAGINQNYSWGQDSWAHFRDALLELKPDVRVANEQFPKLGVGEYAAEISALIQAGPEVIHTSFWGADLNGLVLQSEAKGLFDSSFLLMSVGEYALPELKSRIPPGTIIGAHGPHGAMAPPGELNDWLVDLYETSYGMRPTYPVYHMAQALLGVKMAFENAIVKAGGWPSTEQVIAAFEYLEYPTPSGMIKMALGKGHQAVEPAVYGTAGPYDPLTGEVTIVDMVEYPVECVNPPQGSSTEQWIKEGFPGSECP